MRELVGVNLVKKSCKDFLDLEIQNHVKKHMPKLNIYNSLNTDPKVSLAEQKRLYQDLYTGRKKYLNNNSIETRFPMNFNNPNFTDEQQDL